MALPVILIDSATGSDTLASGAGPSTALTGTSASTDAAGTVVTLDGSPSLTNVATDGSHVIFLNDTTAGARNFGKITAKDDVAKTVTVSNAFGLSLSGKSWAIGGKRASIGGTTSKKLFDNNGAAGDAMPGWIVEMQSGHSESTSFDLRRPGDTTDGPIIFRGAANASTRPLLTLGSSRIVVRGAYIILQDFDVTASANVQLAGTIVVAGVGNCSAIGLKVTGGTDDTAISSFHKVINCYTSGFTNGITCSQPGSVINCRVVNSGGDGIVASGNLSGSYIHGNVITGCGGDGINILQTRTDDYASVRITHNTVNACTGDGFEYGGDSDSLGNLVVMNNSFTNNGGVGLRFGAGITAMEVYARGCQLLNNNFYNNTSGDSNLTLTNNQGNPGIDPQFVDTANDNYSVGANLKGKGFPTTANGVVGGTYSYVDIGAAQRQEPAFIAPSGLIARNIGTY